jgi:hypothetical protein
MRLPSAALEKLLITACSVDDGKISVDEDKSFSVMLNPSNLSVARKINYNKEDTIGQLGPENKFNTYSSQTLGFEIVLDGTGVLSPLVGKQPDDVKTQIEKLNEVVYDYDGEKHEPNHVQVLWGSNLFYCRLESLTIDYSLFKPSGDPLRAKLKFDFSIFMSKEEQALKANKSSPDLSHVVLVLSGDTLPALCHRIYKDASYYPQVARLNNLTNFRKLVPGSTLHFPPLR